MAEFAAEGTEITPAPPERVIYPEQLGRVAEALRQVGNLAHLLIEHTDKSNRSQILDGSSYILGVTDFGTSGHSSEDLNHHLWIRDGDSGFRVQVNNYSLPNQETVLGVAHDRPHGVPISGPSQLQETLDTDNEIQKINLLEAQEWLKKTRKFLLDKLSDLSS